MRLFLYMFGVLSLTPVATARSWTELDGVIYEEEKYSDGDSFRARRNRSKYIFRLYFVDTPETDTRFPDRVQEQADYFGVEFEHAVEGGEAAAIWLHDLLAKEPFTVYTRYANARGASDRKRYYAMVKIGDRWLSELLVENGYARVFGVDAELPDGTSAKKYWSRLKKLEEEAKAAKRGIWATSAALADAPRLITLKAPTPIFQPEPPYTLVGQLPAGWEVKVGAETRPGFRSVSFTSPGGHEFQGEVQAAGLGL